MDHEYEGYTQGENRVARGGKHNTEKTRSREKLLQRGGIQEGEERRGGMWAISTRERVQRGSQKQQKAAPNGFSLFVMRLLLEEHVVCLNGERKTDDVAKRDREVAKMVGWF